jgi:hypothetical protein
MMGRLGDIPIHYWCICLVVKTLKNFGLALFDACDRTRHGAGDKGSFALPEPHRFNCLNCHASLFRVVIWYKLAG